MKFIFTLLFTLLFSPALFAQMSDAPDRSEGEGPFDRLIIRGATMIDGTGSPAVGPVDIVIEGNRIAQIRNVGYPGVPIDESRRPQAEEGDQEIEAEGMYVLPGFVDMHAHIGGNAQGTVPEYVFKLWLAHGITGIREPGSFNGGDWTLRHAERSSNNEITAPRIYPYFGFGMGSSEGINSPDEARD
jgi:predicted amidohydrolase